LHEVMKRFRLDTSRDRVRNAEVALAKRTGVKRSFAAMKQKWHKYRKAVAASHARNGEYRNIYVEKRFETHLYFDVPSHTHSGRAQVHHAATR
jgi:hypothetical protein